MIGELDPVGGGDPIPLLKPRVIIGRRKSKCDIMLEASNISSQHCMITLDKGYLLVEDMNSRNGIKVNDVRCQKRYLLPGDILSIARSQFQVNYQPQTDAPPPEVEEDIMSMSLMEKAGLVTRRPEVKKDSSQPPTHTGSHAPPNVVETEEDQIMQWFAEMPENDDDY